MKYKVYVDIEDTYELQSKTRDLIEAERERLLHLIQKDIFQRLANVPAIISLTVHVEDGDELAIYTPDTDTVIDERTRNV